MFPGLITPHRIVPCIPTCSGKVHVFFDLLFSFTCFKETLSHIFNCNILIQDIQITENSFMGFVLGKELNQMFSRGISPF